MQKEEFERKKELLRYNRKRFQLFFTSILHIDKKSASFLSLILLTESVLVGFGPFIIEKITSKYLMLTIIILIVLTSGFLGYAGFILLRGLHPTQVLLPEIPLESGDINEALLNEYDSLNEFITENETMLTSKSISLYKSIYLIKISIIMLFAILVLLLPYYFYTFFM